MKCRAPHLARLLVFPLLLIVGGAIVNVAVAWGLAAFVDVLSLRLHENEWASSANFPPGMNCTVECRHVPGAIRMMVLFPTHSEYDDEQPFSEYGILPPMRAELYVPYWAVDLLDGTDRMIDGRGWPMMCLRCQAVNLSYFSVDDLVGGVRIGAFGKPHVWSFRALPTIPIWPGFLINTIFYTAILWILFAAPFAFRRWRRVKKGLCPKCAYPVGESPVCSECGKPVRSKSVEPTPP